VPSQQAEGQRRPGEQEPRRGHSFAQQLEAKQRPRQPGGRGLDAGVGKMAEPESAEPEAHTGRRRPEGVAAQPPRQQGRAQSGHDDVEDQQQVVADEGRQDDHQQVGGIEDARLPEGQQRRARERIGIPRRQPPGLPCSRSEHVEREVVVAAVARGDQQALHQGWAEQHEWDHRGQQIHQRGGGWPAQAMDRHAHSTAYGRKAHTGASVKMPRRPIIRRTVATDSRPSPVR
jgi:hypothetical protein